MFRLAKESAAGWGYLGMKPRRKVLKFSLKRRCASIAMVSKTREDLPEPDTPVNTVIFLLGILTETFFRLFSRAPLISMYSASMSQPASGSGLRGEGKGEEQNEP